MLRQVGSGLRSFVLLATLWTASSPALLAQGIDETAALRNAGLGGEADELGAWTLLRSEKPIAARRAAEKVLLRRPNSYLAQLIIGLVLHYAEADFPRALWHLEAARRLFEQRHSDKPLPSDPWQWHARILRELANVQGDLEHHPQKLQTLLRYNELYDPDMLAERAWSLMKMRQFDAARRAAQEGMATADPHQVGTALNALCAIEFEAGKDSESYRECRVALDYARREHGEVNAVDLTNFAEASRSVFKLDEAERILLEATRAQIAWYGNPWLEIAELYTREGRFAESLDALRRVPAYRQRRPTHVRNADLNESKRALAAFLLTASKPRETMAITANAMVTPDRRGHNSRDAAQDRVIVALLDRRARRLVAEQSLEATSGAPWYRRLQANAEALWQRSRAWLSGRQATRLLVENERLSGIVRIGTAESAVMPPWLVGELLDSIGSGIVRQAIAEARRADHRPLAMAYYDAFAAEVAFRDGDARLALDRGRSALAKLERAEALLRARTYAVVGAAAWQLNRSPESIDAFAQSMQIDPGVIRRLELRLPVQLQLSSTPLSDTVAAALRRSPRFDVDDEGPSFLITLRVEANRARLCLVEPSGAEIGCGSAAPRSDRNLDDWVQRLAQRFHEELFAPRIDLSQSDIHSLDGSNRVARDPLDALGIAPGGKPP